jgi:phage gp36-like protein
MGYATLADLEDIGLPPGALQGVSTEAKQAALDKASARASAYLRDQYKLPLTAPYDESLVDAVVQIAAARLMRRRGFNPNSAGDAAIQLGHDEAIAYLQRIANGQGRLAVLQAAPEHLEPQVLTSPARGYTECAGIDSPIGPYQGGL